tara:strand:+ start:182 stop:559 length:378 start_codon:yes stop_codon:yes gene_type:complete
MNTALATYGRTSDTEGFETFTWQAVQKMADQMGVRFYNEKTQYRYNGYGIRATSSNRGFGDTTRIIIEANESPVKGNEFLNHRVRTLAFDNFLLKLELWALKNNVKYVVTSGSNYMYIQIVKAGN